MIKRRLQRLFAGSMSALMLMASVVPVHANGTQTITSDDTTKTKDVAITATVSSDFQVTLPMSIDLVDTGIVEDYGPVFASPAYKWNSEDGTASGTYISVSGTLYGKYLNISVKDTRANSPYNVATGHEYELAMGRATYDADTTTYTVANEDNDVYADVNLDYHKFYPTSETSIPDDATNIIPTSGAANTKNYPLDIRTKSRVSSDGETLYYGQITFTVEAVEY